MLVNGRHYLHYLHHYIYLSQGAAGRELQGNMHRHTTLLVQAEAKMTEAQSKEAEADNNESIVSI